MPIEHFTDELLLRRIDYIVIIVVITYPFPTSITLLSYPRQQRMAVRYVASTVIANVRFHDEKILIPLNLLMVGRRCRSLPLRLFSLPMISNTSTDDIHPLRGAFVSICRRSHCGSTPLPCMEAGCTATYFYRCHFYFSRRSLPRCPLPGLQRGGCLQRSGGPSQAFVMTIVIVPRIE
jgi:hypothetical protein